MVDWSAKGLEQLPGTKDRDLSVVEFNTPGPEAATPAPALTNQGAGKQQPDQHYPNRGRQRINDDHYNQGGNHQDEGDDVSQHITVPGADLNFLAPKNLCWIIQELLEVGNAR